MDMAAAARYTLAEMTYIDPAKAAHREKVIAGIRRNQTKMHCPTCNTTVFVGETIPWWPDDRRTPPYTCSVCKGTMITVQARC
jgi:transposase-like protein